MTTRKIRLAIKWVLKDGESTADVARELTISQRRIQQFIKHFNETGEYPVLTMKRRPKTYLSDKWKELIKQAYNELFLGAKLLRFYIKARYNQNIAQNKIHKYLIELRCAKPEPRNKKNAKNAGMKENTAYRCFMHIGVNIMANI
ncbi:MAG: helix-turn-helix domain-containing protein [ANME-2 cluster archaeon]|nr:helix-turn-helix domain-containing protein [ANME-2 cluster archaeon]